MTTSQQNLVELAKKGDARAIGALMNRHFQPRGIRVRASLREDCLRLVLESEQIPNEQEMVTFIQKGLSTLNSSAIARAKIFGQQIGDDIPIWSRDLELIGRSEPDILVRHAQPIEDAIHCPKCSSTQITSTKKGFGVGKAAVGVLLLGPIGLAGGMVGGNEVMLSCIKCGHQWEPRKMTSSTTQLDRRTTSTVVKVMSVGERVGMSAIAFLICGFFGFALLAIPVIGWIAGSILLVGAITIPYKCLTGDKTFISKLVGNCPHCVKEVEVSSLSAQHSSCSHCKQKFFIRERKFHSI